MPAFPGRSAPAHSRDSIDPRARLLDRAPDPPPPAFFSPRVPSTPQAKKGLHPLLYRVTVVGTKGGTFPSWSTVKQKAGKYFLAADHDTHSLWSGKKVAQAATGQVAKFKRRFDFLSATPTAAKK